MTYTVKAMNKNNTDNKSNFFASVSRMKYIDRWALMRNSWPENLSEHSLEVAIIAHALCVIGNVRFGKNLNADRAAVAGMYHDCAEILTGDMPTPIKYYSEEITDAYKKVEAVAEQTILKKLPEDIRPVYEKIFFSSDDENEEYMRKLVKAADKISALIKCIEEEKSGNTEFRSARATIGAAVDALCAKMPEVDVFVGEFMPSYESTLDEMS